MSLTKGIVRFGIIGALALGTGVVVAEWASPGSVHAIAGQAKGAISRTIDRNVDDPVALRAQIRDLEAEYPEKIADVRSDLIDVQQQIAQLQHEKAVSEKVVALTQSDLSVLSGGIEEARAVQSANQGVIVKISFQSRSLGLNDAFARRDQIDQTRSFHASRVAELNKDLGYLSQQEEQLSTLLTRLETERAEFQAQLFQLDAQVDAIDRNDRLIAMMEDRQKTIEEHTRYQAHSLDQLHSRLAGIRAKQQARLESITTSAQARDYEAEAQFLIDTDGANKAPSTEISPTRELQIEPQVIEITPSTDGSAGPMASRN
ncbi:MAG: hypothetical protein DYG94_13090 [Leptolyngbya sp. PLA3]|nr:MAG: hypothetical protein EDM82_03265 [Cyanobacteria bacterium CYA]MCE7969661.1 hypothetical protein [Leptolyngbya sp. PL-A3]